MNHSLILTCIDGKYCSRHSKTTILHTFVNTLGKSNEFKWPGQEFLTADEPAVLRYKSEGQLQWRRQWNSHSSVLHLPTAKREIPLSATSLAAPSTGSSERPFVIKTAIWVNKGMSWHNIEYLTCKTNIWRQKKPDRKHDHFIQK